MAKSYQSKKVRQETISVFGKSVGKRAGFQCEWCGSKEDLRLWDYKPEIAPNMETLALLCGRCHDLANGRHAGAEELRLLRNALWNNTPSVAEGVARVLARCPENWARTAIGDSYINDSVKDEILRQTGH
ncbi:MAG: hypothetical protein ABSA86_07465 [Oryzomonas sp.]|jgi:protein PhnA